MTGYIGYTRVSTVKQGTKGVSLQEQRDAILRYAERNGFTISIWLEEMETAAKQGRPVFTQALKLLKGGKAKGIILHKLDRGARNLRDWAAIGELSDQGIEVHFVSEAIDLQSRGGRLSADIQAVVAADYIRNLREETRKGFYGRLKQGLYPLQAPLGYRDEGKGKAKTIDPVSGPLVRKAFELYASGRYNLDSLAEEIHRLGLRNRNGTRLARSSLSFLLNNPFYFGVMHIKRTGESFAGIHEPIIGKSLFDRVHAVLTGKTNGRTQKHFFPYRRLLTCASCRHHLVGERQKGHTYYRCHTKGCPIPCVREEVIDAEVARFFTRIRFDEDEKAYFRSKVLGMRKNWANDRDDVLKGLNLKLGQLSDRLNRLTDAYLDQALDKAMFEERKNGLLFERKSVEESIGNLNRNDRKPDDLGNFLELAGMAWLSHHFAAPQERPEMIKIATSNREVTGKSLDLKPSIAFQPIVDRHENIGCAPQRDRLRTWDKILDTLARLNAAGQLPDLSSIPGFRKPDADDVSPESQEAA